MSIDNGCQNDHLNYILYIFLTYVCTIKMKNLEKILLFLTILLVVFNLTQLNVYNFLGDENRIALICFILSLCALILILILMISKRIKNRYRN
jgi:L-lactate permease